MWVPLAVIVLEVFTKFGGNSRVIYTENKVVSLNKCVQYKYDIYDYFDLFFCYRNNIVMNYSYLSNPL